jgi:hypothetical protein
MILVLKILGAIGIGLYSCIAIHFYSILMSRIKKDIIRFLLYLTGLVLFIFVPFIGCAALASQLHERAKDGGNLSLITVMFCWLGPVWLYIILNWRTLNQKLRLPKKDVY